MSLRRKYCWPSCAWALALFLMVAVPTTGQAGLSLRIDPSTSDSTGMGSFDVVLITDDMISDLASFTISLNVAQNGTGFEFTKADKTSSVPFIFQTDFGYHSLFESGNLSLVANDDADVSFPDFGVNVMPGTYGLAHVSYKANHPGTAIVSFDTTELIPGDPTSSATVFINGNDASTFPVDSYISGEQAINVAAVPEPSTLISGGTAILLGLAYGWRRRKAETAA